MTESLEREIRDLRSLFWSDRDPDGRAFAPLADAYRRAGDYRHALELLNEGLDRLPTFATGHVVSAQVHLEAGLTEEAELASLKALELDGDNVRALRTLADVLSAKGEGGGAAGVLERLHVLEPSAGEPDDAVEPSPRSESDDVEEPPSPHGAAAVDISALAPTPGADEEVASEESAAVDIGALAPEPEVLEIGALAPEDAPEALDIAALAPESAEEPEALDIGALAPESAEEPAALDIGALAPESAEEPAALDIGALAPESTEESADTDIGALAPDEGVGWEAGGETAEPSIYTRTMAELYVRQGLEDQAIEVYRHLLEASPDDTRLHSRLAELEAGREEGEEETELHARHLAAAGERGPTVETPFAWTEEDPTESGESAPPISRYFSRMLAWAPDEERR